MHNFALLSCFRWLDSQSPAGLLLGWLPDKPVRKRDVLYREHHWLPFPTRVGIARTPSRIEESIVFAARSALVRSSGGADWPAVELHATDRQLAAVAQRDVDRVWPTCAADQGKRARAAGGCE